MPACSAASRGSTCSVTVGHPPASIRRWSCSRMTAGPPTGRRSAASSMITQSVGGSASVRSRCRALRPDDRLGVADGLEQTRNDHRLVDVDRRGRRLEPDQGPDDLVVEGVPPAPLSTLPGELHQLVPLPPGAAAAPCRAAAVAPWGSVARSSAPPPLRARTAPVALCRL